MQLVVQQETVDVVAEVCIAVLAEVGFTKSGAFGKDVIELTLVNLAGEGEAVDERAVTQAAGVRQQISNSDLVWYVIFEVDTRSASVLPTESS